MQIKPHQIPHFARQRERLAEIRNIWNAEPKEEGSYFSKRFVGVNQFVNWFSSEFINEYSKIVSIYNTEKLINGDPQELKFKGIL